MEKLSLVTMSSLASCKILVKTKYLKFLTIIIHDPSDVIDIDTTYFLFHIE